MPAAPYPSVLSATDVSSWEISPSGRLLSSIQRDMRVKDNLFKIRRRNEEILALIYLESQAHGGGDQWQNIRENALNFPYRFTRWFEAQATGREMTFKVSRDAGPGQVPGGPGDEVTGKWVAITLRREADRMRARREIKAAIAEIIPRGTSVIKVGFHEEAITSEDAQEAGKNPQSVIVDVVQGDGEAHPGQDHVAISEGLKTMASDETVQKMFGREGVDALLERADAHDEAAFLDETDESPRQSVRMIRRRAYIRKLRVGEDVGWAPWITDTEDTPYWWERHVWTVAEVKASDLFTDEFKAEVKGYDCRTASEVFQGGRMPSHDDMDSDERIAQSEDMLTDDEKVVEWFRLWFRRPDMRAGGYVKIVSPEMPDKFIEADDSNPFVDSTGKGIITGFYPYFDITPIQSSLNVPARTCGIPPMAVAMPMFEKIAEYKRIRQEEALKGATSIVQVHPALKEAAGIVDAINKGEVRKAFICPEGLMTPDGKMVEAVATYSFSGTSHDIQNQEQIEKIDGLNSLGMPIAIWQGMGTAPTLGQDKQGIAAGEQESKAILNYIKDRVGDVFEAVRAIIREFYDDEEFIALLGEEGAAVMKAWQDGSVDDGDRIIPVFGEDESAQKLADQKMLMEAITLKASQVDSLGIRIYNIHDDIDELNRRFDLGAVKLNEERDLEAIIQRQQQIIEQLVGAVQKAQKQGGENKKGSQKKGGPRKSQGAGPSDENIDAGAKRGTQQAASFPVLAGV